MGDHADDLIDRSFDAEYFGGDEDFDEDFYPGCHSLGKTCRYCRARGLTWGQVDGKWRLFEGKEIHQCSARSLHNHNPRQ